MIWQLLDLLSHGPPEEGRDLAAGAGGVGVEASAADAGGDAAFHGPGHGVCVVAVSGDVGEVRRTARRGLVNGMNDSIYAPNASTTRAQLWTILARQNNADLNGGNTWYEKAQLWSKDKGISDGANPNGTINRAQMVTMLWRAVGQPTAGGTASFIDVPADAYYAGAVSWAVENGITTGVGGGRFNPTGACTRAQIAAFLARSMK